MCYGKVFFCLVNRFVGDFKKYLLKYLVMSGMLFKRRFRSKNPSTKEFPPPAIPPLPRNCDSDIILIVPL